MAAFQIFYHKQQYGDYSIDVQADDITCVEIIGAHNVVSVRLKDKYNLVDVQRVEAIPEDESNFTTRDDIERYVQLYSYPYLGSMFEKYYFDIAMHGVKGEKFQRKCLEWIQDNIREDDCLALTTDCIKVIERPYSEIPHVQIINKYDSMSVRCKLRQYGLSKIMVTNNGKDDNK